MSPKAEFEFLLLAAVLIKFMLQNPKSELLPVTSVPKSHIPRTPVRISASSDCPE
jgi:hypothetical protein